MKQFKLVTRVIAQNDRSAENFPGTKNARCPVVAILSPVPGGNNKGRPQELPPTGYHLTKRWVSVQVQLQRCLHSVTPELRLSSIFKSRRFAC